MIVYKYNLIILHFSFTININWSIFNRTSNTLFFQIGINIARCIKQLYDRTFPERENWKFHKLFDRISVFLSITPACLIPSLYLRKQPIRKEITIEQEIALSFLRFSLEFLLRSVPLIFAIHFAQATKQVCFRCSRFFYPNES